ncbi:hypothetical protein ACQKWADRAFT_305291 [Trichoderma austrokoningii]
MAPSSKATKTRKPAVVASKPVPRRVTPAIPLPHVKRQAAAAAAKAAAATAASVAVTALPSLDNTKPDDNPRNGTRGVQTNDANQSSSPTLIADSAHASDSLPDNSSQEWKSATQTDLSSQSAEVIDTPKDKPGATADHVAGPGGSSSHDAMQPRNLGAPPAAPTARETPPELQIQPRDSARYNPAQYPPVTLVSSQPPLPVSPTRYQMPPPFQPANPPPMGIAANGDLSRGPRHPLPGPLHIHQAHPSNGSIHFGVYHDSQSSSPAPPHSGGIVPPPGMPMPDGRPHPMMPHNGSGFPPMVPYMADMMPVANFDGYGRPIAYPPMESYHQYGGNALGQSTPLSFHDSQSSAHAEEAAMYNQYRGAPLSNGATAGPGDEAQAQNQSGGAFRPPEYPHTMPNHGLPPHMAQGDDADGLLGYLQQHFASPPFADCTLELRYIDDWAAPMRIPGHKLIFARSSHLLSLLQTQAFQSSLDDRSPQTILIETGSKWIRSSSFYMAVQRLYGLPLFQAPPPRVGMESGDVIAAGSTNEQIAFAISYAAAGHLLAWPSVVRRGCEVAARLLSWETLETALEFALDGYQDKGSHDVYKYEVGSPILLSAIVTFIVHNFPSHSNIDTEAVKLAPYSRLPINLPPLTKSSSSDMEMLSAPAAEGSQVQLGNGRRPRKINGIQFGDLSLADANTPKATRAAQPISVSVLSRVLLEIPFRQLKRILESSGSGNVNGWANAESRYRIIKMAVEERESRRRRVLDAVLSGQGLCRDDELELIRQGLCSPEPRDLGRWTALGWQEELLPYGNPDGPTLARKWVPLANAQSGPMSNVSEYP